MIISLILIRREDSIKKVNRNIYISRVIILYHMLQKYSKYKILQEFFDFPMKNFQIRELSRKVKITLPSVSNHIKSLLKDGFIIKEKKGIYPSFKANRESDLFKTYRKADLLIRIYDSGLIDFINDKCLQGTIILFGSGAKGEDIEQSDIDLFIQSSEKKLDLSKYEKILNRKISLFFEERFSKLNDELKNNLLNGIVLKGYLKVF